MFKIKNFIFMDLETTGLPRDQNYTTRIAEICLTAVQVRHIVSGTFPRVQNKLLISVYPWKLIDLQASQISGLTNFNLEGQPDFKKVAGTISGFLEAFEKPICLVAHNGNGFDYPILIKELFDAKCSLSDDVYCVDSYQYFLDIDAIEKESGASTSMSTLPVDLCGGYDVILSTATDKLEEKLTKTDIQKINETTPKKQILPELFKLSSSSSLKKKPRRLNFYDKSYKLEDIYKRLTSKEPKNCHSAEDDVNSLIVCLITQGQRFLDWANKNAKLFSEIPMMKAGKHSGI